MGTQKVELERAGEKSAVDGSDPVSSFIHNHIIRPKSSGRVTHDSHKLLTKVTCFSSFQVLSCMHSMPLLVYTHIAVIILHYSSHRY